MDIKQHPWIVAIIVALIAGFGNLLASGEKLTWRIIIGRALSSTGLGVAAGTLYLWFPDMHPMALAGSAALFASLGTSGLERLFQMFIGRRG